jgi:hypothetical protein
MACARAEVIARGLASPATHGGDAGTRSTRRAREPAAGGGGVRRGDREQGQGNREQERRVPLFRYRCCSLFPVTVHLSLLSRETHLPRHRHLLRRAGDRLRLRRLHLGRPARPQDAARGAAGGGRAEAAGGHAARAAAAAGGGRGGQGGRRCGTRTATPTTCTASTICASSRSAAAARCRCTRPRGARRRSATGSATSSTRRCGRWRGLPSRKGRCTR